MSVLVRLFGSRLHYAWIVTGAMFLALMISAGVRSMPGVLMVPMADDLHWDVAQISLAVSIGLALYGLTGPFAAALVHRYGIRKIVPAALALLAVAVAATTFVTAPWQMVLTWGLLTGVGCGLVASVLAAQIVGRWFRARRGVALGLLTASVQTGQLIFVPLLAFVATNEGWRHASLIVAVAALVVIPIVVLLVPERPSAIGIAPYGATAIEPADSGAGNPLAHAFAALGRGVRQPIFWLLAVSFFVCGLSTNGLIGTHMIALCQDHGIPVASAAWLLAAMGIFDLVGTTVSGWLSDRYDNRMLLAWYYGLRGISLLLLPFSNFSVFELSIFAVFYGLDWIATVPPTVRLATKAFGERDGPIVYGWIICGHQLGAATAAFGAGLLRSVFDTYLQAFLISGVACVVIAMMLIGMMSGVIRVKQVVA